MLDNMLLDTELSTVLTIIPANSFCLYRHLINRLIQITTSVITCWKLYSKILESSHLKVIALCLCHIMLKCVIILSKICSQYFFSNILSNFDEIIPRILILQMCIHEDNQ